MAINIQYTVWAELKSMFHQYGCKNIGNPNHRKKLYRNIIETSAWENEEEWKMETIFRPL